MKNEYGFYFAYSARWTGRLNMEFDHLLGEVCPPSIPLVRLYTWDTPTISLGCHQNPARRLDLELCAKDDIPVVRRPTGGRELLHGHDICYSVVWPLESRKTAVDARKIFAAINVTLVSALRDLRISGEWNEFQRRPKTIDGPCFAQVDSGEITVHGRKLVASAQRVFTECIVQQGSIPLVRPPVDLIKYLRVEDKAGLRAIVDRGTAFLEDLTDSPVSAEVLIEPIRNAFRGLFGGPSESANEIFENFRGIIESESGNMSNGLVEFWRGR